MSGGRLTPQEFVARWRGRQQNERQVAQQHYLDLCALFDQPSPAAADPTGTWYTFEKGVAKTGGGQGFADVWRRGHFAWEYKGPKKDLAAAYGQLLLYREALENPPPLVVYDIERFEVHTNFTRTMPSPPSTTSAPPGSPTRTPRSTAPCSTPTVGPTTSPMMTCWRGYWRSTPSGRA